MDNQRDKIIPVFIEEEMKSNLRRQKRQYGAAEDSQLGEIVRIIKNRI